MRWKWWKVHRDEIMMKTRWIQFSFIWGLEPVPALQRHLANTSPAGRRRETSLRHRWDIAETSLSRRPSSKRSPRTAWLFVFLAPFHRLGRYFYDFLIFSLFLIILIFMWFMSSISFDFYWFLFIFHLSLPLKWHQIPSTFSCHCGAKTCPECPKRPRTSMRRGQGPGGNLPRYQDDRHLSRNSQNMVDQEWSKYWMHCMSWYSSNDSNRFWIDW